MKHDLPVNDRIHAELAANGVAHIRLNRPDKLNALDPAMFAALVETGQALAGLPGLRCVVLSGEGRGFCAGLDLATLQLFAGPDAPRLPDRSHGNANLFQQVAVQWRKLPVPVIAAVHGVCFGGGLQIAAGTDVRVIAPDARLSVMEMKWGIIPDMGGFALWRGHVREDVLRLATYTNREFSGEDAVAQGFATFADPDPLARALAIAADVASRNPDAIRAAKALFNRAPDMGFDEILIEESVVQQRLIGSRNQMEAVRAQLTGSAPEFSDPK